MPFSEPDLTCLIRRVIGGGGSAGAMTKLASEKFMRDVRRAVPSISENQANQLYVLGLIFGRQGHETELVLQSLGFGSPADTVILIRCLEAIFFLL